MVGDPKIVHMSRQTFSLLECSDNQIDQTAVVVCWFGYMLEQVVIADNLIEVLVALPYTRARAVTVAASVQTTRQGNSFVHKVLKFYEKHR